MVTWRRGEALVLAWTPLVRVPSRHDSALGTEPGLQHEAERPIRPLSRPPFAALRSLAQAYKERGRKRGKEGIFAKSSRT